MPSLFIDIEARFAKFQDGLDQIGKQAKSVERAFSGLQRGITFLGVGFSVAGLARSVKATIDLADDFSKASEKFGISTERLSALKFAGDFADLTDEDRTRGLKEFSKSLVEAADSSSKAGKLFAALGVDINAGVYEAIKQTADAFQQLAAGETKATLSGELFGKSGLLWLDLLNQGRQGLDDAEQSVKDLGTEISGDFANDAKNFNDDLKLIAIQIDKLKISAAGGVVDALGTLAKNLAEASKSGDLLVESLRELAKIDIAAIGAVLSALVPAPLRPHINDAAAAAFAAVSGPDKAGLRSVSGKITRPAGATTPSEQRIKDILSGGDKGSADDPRKKLLENQLRALENLVKQEEDLFADRNRVLDLYNDANLISFEQYYAGRRLAAEDAVTAQIRAFDAEIAALEQYRGKSSKKTDQAEATGKINDLLAKKADLQRKAASDAVALGFEEQRAYRDLAREIQNVNAELLELQGNAGAAAKIRVDQEYDDLIKRLTAQGDTGGLAQVNTLKQAKVAQADYNQEAERSQQILGQLDIVEQRIALSREVGAIGELESLRRLGVERQAALAQLEEVVAAQEAIAEASGNPALVLAAQRARLELEQLAAVADPLADKFNTLFEESFADAFGDFISGSKSAKDAFKDFADTVNAEILRMISQDIAKSLFGGLFGGSGGIGGFLSKIFGGGSSSGDAGSSAGVAALGVSATGATTALAALTSAATAAAAALGVSAGASTAQSGTGFLSTIAGFFGFENGGVMTSRGPLPLMKYAGGGVASRPQLALFGEGSQNEAFVPLPDGRRIPVRMQGGGAVNLTQNFHIAGQADGRTQQQIAAAAMRGGSAALRRSRA